MTTTPIEKISFTSQTRTRERGFLSYPADLVLTETYDIHTLGAPRTLPHPPSPSRYCHRSLDDHNIRNMFNFNAVHFVDHDIALRFPPSRGQSSTPSARTIHSTT